MASWRDFPSIINRMKKFLIPFTFLLSLTLALPTSAQEITTQKLLKVSGYSINSIGYPGKIVPIREGGFTYTEFWTQGSGRKFPGYYVQGVNPDLSEQWFAPVADQGGPQMKNLEVFKLKKHVAVTGMKYHAPFKRDISHVRFFTFDGKPKGGVMQLSSFDKKAKKGYVNNISISSDSTKLLWWGNNPGAKAKKQRYYFSVYSDNGQIVWKKRLFIPHTAEGYVVDYATVDSKGNVYLLMTYEKFTNSEKDTVNLPMVIRYDYRESKFAEHAIEMPSASVPASRIHINAKGELCFVGVASDGSENGFNNGEKRFGVALKWNKLIFKKFEITRELRLQKEYVMDMPEEWVKKYGERGANFSLFSFLEKGDQLFWIAEEFYTQIHNGQNQFLYYDVGVVALNMKSGVIDWATSFQKKQRDYNSGRMLSFVNGFINGHLRFVYLNERGAGGYIVCTSVNAKDGKSETKRLVQNKKADYLFFPRRSAQVGGSIVLMGVGNPNGNDYKLIKVGF